MLKFGCYREKRNFALFFCLFLNDGQHLRPLTTNTLRAPTSSTTLSIYLQAHSARSSRKPTNKKNTLFCTETTIAYSHVIVRRNHVHKKDAPWSALQSTPRLWMPIRHTAFANGRKLENTDFHTFFACFDFQALTITVPDMTKYIKKMRHNTLYNYSLMHQRPIRHAALTKWQKHQN